MQQSLMHGAQVAARCFPLAVLFWTISLSFGLGFSVVSGYWLDDALDASLATRTLLRDLDPNVLIDLYVHHGEGLRMLVAQAVVMGAGYLAIWFWLHGALVFAVVREGAGVAESLRHGLALAAVMARLFLIAAGVLALYSALVGGTVWAVLRWVLVDSPEPRRELAVAAAAVVWLAGYVALVAVHDHARLRACEAASGSLRSYAWAVRLVRRGGKRAYPLALALNAAAVAVWGVYQAIGTKIPVSEEIGMTALIVWGELFVLARLVLRVWFFAAQAELHRPGAPISLAGIAISNETPIAAG